MNTGFPVAMLAGLAVLLPRLLVPRDTRSHRMLALGIAGSAGLLLAAGWGIFFAAYAAMGADPWAALGERPLAVWMLFTRLSGMAALAWAPILAIVWFSAAQRVEAWRGEDAAGRRAR